VQQCGHRELLEEGDDISERLAERQHVVLARLEKKKVQPIQERVRRLVRHDVGRQCREDQPLAGFRRARRRRRKIAKQERLARRAVDAFAARRACG